MIDSPGNEELEAAFSGIIKKKDYASLKNEKPQQIEIALLYSIRDFIENKKARKKTSKIDFFRDINHFLHERHYVHSRLKALYSMTMNKCMGTLGNRKRAQKKASEAFEEKQEWLREFFPDLSSKASSSSKSKETELDIEEETDNISDDDSPHPKPFGPPAAPLKPTDPLYINEYGVPICVDENGVLFYMNPCENFCPVYFVEQIGNDENEAPLTQPDPIGWFDESDSDPDGEYSLRGPSLQIIKITFESGEFDDENDCQSSGVWEVVIDEDGTAHHVPLETEKINSLGDSEEVFPNSTTLSRNESRQSLKRPFSTHPWISKIFNSHNLVGLGCTWYPNELSQWCNLNKLSTHLFLARGGFSEEEERENKGYPEHLQRSIDIILFEDPVPLLAVYGQGFLTSDEPFPQDFPNQNQRPTKKVSPWSPFDQNFLIPAQQFQGAPSRSSNIWFSIETLDE